MISDILKVFELAGTAIKIGKRTVDTINSQSTTGSMVEFTKQTRSEPITMIDHKIINQPELSDLLTTLTSIYAAMYSQSVSLALAEEVEGISVVKTLDRINPNRDYFGGKAVSFESTSLKLPSFKNPSLESVIYHKNSATGNITVGFDIGDVARATATTTSSTDFDVNVDFKAEKNENKITDTRVNTEAITKFSSNLTTGILFEIVINKTTIPLSVRLIVNELHQSNVISIMSAAVKNRTAVERYHEWRAGGLSFWNDIILCRDIIRENRKNTIKDKTGIVQEILSRKNKNKLAGLLSGKPSISAVSNILVVSKETIDKFETESFKKIKDAKVRDLIFNNTQVMILAVVDPDREIVTLYYHSLALPSVATFRDLKAAGKKQGLDAMEVLRSFQMGGTVRF